MVALADSRTDIYRRHAVELTRFAASLVGPNDAADVVADAVMHAMWSDRWPSVRNPRAYLYQAVLNQSRMHHRTTARRRDRERRGAPRDVVPPDAPDLDTWAALGHLSVQQRAVVFLTYWEDLSPTDVANHLRVSPRSVRRYLATARARLREVLDDVR